MGWLPLAAPLSFSKTGSFASSPHDEFALYRIINSNDEISADFRAGLKILKTFYYYKSMTYKNPPQKLVVSYSTTAIVFHWLMALGLVANFAFGTYMHDLPLSPQKLQYYSWHKWAGITPAGAGDPATCVAIGGAPPCPAAGAGLAAEGGARAACIAIYIDVRHPPVGLDDELGERVPGGAVRRVAVARPGSQGQAAVR
jgi:hypothetical protein